MPQFGGAAYTPSTRARSGGVPALRRPYARRGLFNGAVTRPASVTVVAATNSYYVRCFILAFDVGPPPGSSRAGGLNGTFRLGSTRAAPCCSATHNTACKVRGLAGCVLERGRVSVLGI